MHGGWKRKKLTEPTSGVTRHTETMYAMLSRRRKTTPPPNRPLQVRISTATAVPSFDFPAARCRQMTVLTKARIVMSEKTGGAESSVTDLRKPPHFKLLVRLLSSRSNISSLRLSGRPENLPRVKVRQS